MLQIKTITIQSTEELQLLGLEEIKGRNMLLTPEKEIQSILLSKNPALHTIEVKKEYPDILRLKISYLQPFVQFQTNSNYLILGKSGKIIEKKKDKVTDIPLIKYYQKIADSNYIPGDTLDLNEIQSTLQLYQSAFDLGLKIDTIDINGQNVIAFDVSNSDIHDKLTKILFSTEKDIAQQQYELKTIIRKLSLEGQTIKSLDLRFNRPVITIK